MWILTIPIFVVGQDFVKIDTIESKSKELEELTNKEEILSIESIDFTGDKNNDFIVKTKIDENGYKICEYWISSKYELIRQIETYNDGIKMRKYINLDNDPELEIIDASGYEDGIDYTVQNINLNTGELETVLYFNPIIETETKNYWGYPWDWTKLKIKSDKRIKVSLQHEIERDREISFPRNQKILPAIYFDGTPTQESHVGKIQESTWLSLKEIIGKAVITR